MKVVKSSEATPLWRLVREVRRRQRTPLAHYAYGAYLMRARNAQLYVQACCSTPRHDNVCRLLGWGSPNSGDGTLAGLEEGAVVYMVQENAGEEINKIFSPNQAYRYLKQIVQGTRPAFAHRVP